jgi:hypothetical protein
MKTLLKLLLTTLLFIPITASSQIAFLTTKTPLSGNVSIVNIEAPYLTDDQLNDKSGEAFEIGKLLPANINFIDEADITQVVNGSIWRLAIKAEGAKAISLYYDQFDIPYGGKLLLYNINQTQTAGPFTYKHVHSSGVYATELTYGDIVVLEYFQPSYQTNQPTIKINNIAYAYKALGGGSDYCQVNANCPEGDEWEDQKKATCRIQIVDGFSVGLCSGSMINNTSNNCTPYVLSADHCFSGGSISASSLNQCVFYFNYLTPSCSNSSPSSDAITGCSLVSNSGGQGSGGDSDFFLVELNQESDFDPFYAGWNRSNTPSNTGVSLHHPAGDVMKISTYSGSLQSTGGLGGGANNNTHWRVYWSQTSTNWGVTEGGSSGSPIFDSNKLIVGDLTGGSSYCNTPNNPDIYGKIWYSWDQMGNNSNQQLKPWLDPNNTGVLTHMGMYCNGTPGCTDPDALNYNSNATLDDGSCEYPCFANEVTLSFLPDCYGEEISWELNDENGTPIYSVGQGFYPGGSDAQTMNPDPDPVEQTWCLTNGCYTFTVQDSFGDGMNGANPEYACGQNGDYTILDLNGNILASLLAENAEFGESENNEFCVNSEVIPTWSCSNGNCSDPGDGSGQYGSETLCITACNESWDCLSGNCTDPEDGSGEFSSLVSCESDCAIIPITWTCVNEDCYNPGDGSGEFNTETSCINECTINVPSYDCLNGNCFDPEDGTGEFLSFLACNASCTTKSEETWDCINSDCFDPGDGSGQYDSESWCVSECHNNSVYEILDQQKTIIKIVNILGQEVESIIFNTPLFLIYDDGSVEKKFIVE